MQTTTIAPSANRYIRPRVEPKSETKPELKTEAVNHPEKKFRAGSVTATIWLNKSHNAKGEDGEYYTITMERSYTDKEGKWQTTNSLRVNDLPKATIVLQKAYEHIVLQEQDLSKGGN